MTISIDDFMANATKEQEKLLYDLVVLGKRENEVCEAYNKIIASYKKAIDNTNTTKEGQYSKIIKEDMEDFALIATVSERKELKQIKKDMKELYIKSLELGMGNLGFIQRNYPHYVGEEIPNKD